MIERKQFSLSFDSVAQVSHVAIAAAVVGLASARFHEEFAKYIAACVVVIGAAVKEFAFDSWAEDPATRGSDLEDFCFYVLGAGVALLILWNN